MKRKILAAAFGLFIIFAFSGGVQAQKARVMTEARKVVAALKNKDMRTLAALVHPTKGLRFAPYGYLDDSDLVFQKSQVPSLFLLRRTYLWGSFDGSGDPINLGFPAYYKTFVFDSDFTRAPQISYNKKIGAGNTVMNIKEIYPDAKFVEYHFPGTNKKYGGMDWRSLRLVFEPRGGRWYLVAISHDQWTI